MHSCLRHLRKLLIGLEKHEGRAIALLSFAETRRHSSSVSGRLFLYQLRAPSFRFFLANGGIA